MIDRAICFLGFRRKLQRFLFVTLDAIFVMHDKYPFFSPAVLDGYFEREEKSFIMVFDSH